MSLLTKGNTKVKDTLLFDLPTSVCKENCLKCYARKAEKCYPNVLPFRKRNYKASLENSFVDQINAEIKKSKYNIIRPHASGDFYSQEYIEKWTTIAIQNPDKKFYAYTKNKKYFDFKKLESLPNVNIIDSITSEGYNYGSKDYCDKLIKQGYKLCPAIKGSNIKCMQDCKVCLTEKKICFLQH